LSIVSTAHIGQMGCSTGKQQENIPKLRRKLSLGNIDSTPEGEVASGEDATEADRTLLMELSMQDVFDYIEADKNAGRKFSLGSQTDETKVKSFSDKSTTMQGEPYDVQKNGIGCACKKGLKPESPNQDSFLVLKVGDNYCLYGVFDGHGRKGHDVSNFIKENLPKILFSQDCFTENPQSAIEKTFRKMQYLIEKATNIGTIDASRSGSTCSIVLHDTKNNVLHVAHVGDSRVVLAKESKNADGTLIVQAKDLTIDHKPELPEERKRIEAAGGMVVFDGAWNHRVYAKKKDKNGRSYPGLNMSRAMGDLKGYHEAGISATPDINSRRLREDGDDASPADDEETGMMCSKPSVTSLEIESVDKFILLCSDGVWEYVDSDSAVKIANQFPFTEATKAAEQLSMISWDRWVDELEGEVVDDITAVVVHLKGRPKNDTDKAGDKDVPIPLDKQTTLSTWDDGEEAAREEPLLSPTNLRPAKGASCAGNKV